MELLLTERALFDIVEIEAYSAAKWGRSHANKYIEEIENALSLLQEQPGLLKSDEALHCSLFFYRVKRHFLVCDLGEQAIIVLTIIHGSRDIPSRLLELQPTLYEEIEVLHRKLATLRDRS